MTCLNINPPAPKTLPSWLTLPQSLQGLTLLERHLLGAAYVSQSSERAESRPDAADIEYASWLPDPGALEIASWASNIRSAVR